MVRLALFLIWLVAFVAAHGKAKDDALDSKVTCDTMFCASGQECVERHGRAQCECVERCLDGVKTVCGSNGTHMRTYPSECHLFQDACQKKDKETITLIAPVSCEEEKKNERTLTDKIERDINRVKPVVCMQKERDSLRTTIIDWIKSEMNVEDVEMTYSNILTKYFQSLDKDEDGALNTTEFMKIIGNNDKSVTEFFSKDPHTNAILHGLCMNELIAITDHNSDYKLEFEEFLECLNPSFTPPHEHCECDGKIYDDGHDIQKECNTCKCACGHWVCTHIKCNKGRNTVRD